MNHSFLEVNIMGIIIFALLLFHNRKIQNIRKSGKTLNKVIAYIIITLLSDMLYFANEGQLYPAAREISGILMVIYFISTALSSYCWLLYVYREICGSSTFTRFYKIVIMLPMIALVALTALSFATGWIFYISGENVYVRGPLYFIQLILAYGYVIVGALVSFRQYSKEILEDRKRSCLILSFYTLLPLAGGIVQTFYFGLNTAIPSAVIAIVMLYLDNIKRAVSLDHLTGLNNRGQFDIYLNEKIRSSVKNELYLIVLDIDSFKLVNDTFGHVEGDKSIMAVANALKTVFGYTNAFLSRYGGDEFTVIIDTEESTVLACIAKVNTLLEEFSKASPYSISVSAGYRKYSEGIQTADRFIKLSDEKMYENKLGKQSNSRM